MYDDADLMAEYTTYISTIFSLYGYNSSAATAATNGAIRVEKDIAHSQAANDQLIDPFTTYNKMTIQQLTNIAPDLPWVYFFNGIGVGKLVTNIVVQWPPFCTDMAKRVASEPVDALKSYLYYYVLNTYASYLSQ